GIDPWPPWSPCCRTVGLVSAGDLQLVCGPQTLCGHMQKGVRLMLRHTLFQHRGKIRMRAVLVGLWLSCFLSVLPLHAAQLWEEGSGAATGEQPVLPAFVELAKHLKPAVVNISSKE